VGVAGKVLATAGRVSWSWQPCQRRHSCWGWFEGHHI